MTKIWRAYWGHRCKFKCPLCQTVSSIYATTFSSRWVVVIFYLDLLYHRLCCRHIFVYIFMGPVKACFIFIIFYHPFTLVSLIMYYGILLFLWWYIWDTPSSIQLIYVFIWWLWMTIWWCVLIYVFLYFSNVWIWCGWMDHILFYMIFYHQWLIYPFDIWWMYVVWHMIFSFLYDMYWWHYGCKMDMVLMIWWFRMDVS